MGMCCRIERLLSEHLCETIGILYTTLLSNLIGNIVLIMGFEVCYLVCLIMIIIIMRRIHFIYRPMVLFDSPKVAWTLT